MPNSAKDGILIFVIATFLLLTSLGLFIVVFVLRYQKRHFLYYKELEAMKASYANTLLESQLEIQEQTFQHMASEIHDNIGQKLTLAKLYLNTLCYQDIDRLKEKVSASLDLITDSISNLSDLSRGMSTELILESGLAKAIETEVDKLNKSGLYKASFRIAGDDVFLTGNAELLLFRITQECINNFIKHSGGDSLQIDLDYNRSDVLVLSVSDNGNGIEMNHPNKGSGLIHMQKRTALLKGKMEITSNNGTTVKITIPIHENR